jgi:putative transposase
VARYGQVFKDRPVARLLPPENAALEVVAREVGIVAGTLERWREDAGARLEAVIITASMSEAGKSAWCREHGVYPAELDKWRSSCITALAEPEEARASPQATRADRKELERDLLSQGPRPRGDGSAAGAVKKSCGDLQQGRRRMIGLEDRQGLAPDIDVAHRAGARLHLACETTDIELRTLQRWKADEGLTAGDGRPRAVRPMPSHALSRAERERILAVVNEPRFAAVPPARIVPALADQGIYLASESSFARVLREHGQNAHRGRAKAPKASRPPTTHIAAAAREVWCWDMSYLPATVMGRWFHLYLILDLYSRKIVGWEVHDTDEADHAAHLVGRTALAEGIAAMPAKPVLHGDNGSTLKATTVLAMLNRLGVKPSYSRPRVSDDNAYAESLFRTAKYRPEFPAKGFADLDEARAWAAGFVRWYNHDHRHSGIRYVSPPQRHAGEDRAIVAARHALYTRARALNPARRSGVTRNWSPVGPVTLNPERESIIKTHSATNDIQPVAA